MEAKTVTMSPLFPGKEDERFFVDTKGKRWPLELSVASYSDVKRATGADLQRVLDNRAELLVSIHEDPALLANIGFLLVPEESREGISESAFCSLLRGDALESLAMGVLACIMDFLRDKRSRDEFRNVVVKLKQLADRMLSQASEQLAKFDPDAVDLDESPAINGETAPAGSPEPFPTSDK